MRASRRPPCLAMVPAIALAAGCLARASAAPPEASLQRVVIARGDEANAAASLAGWSDVQQDLDRLVATAPGYPRVESGAGGDGSREVVVAVCPPDRAATMHGVVRGLYPAAELRPAPPGAAEACARPAWDARLEQARTVQVGAQRLTVSAYLRQPLKRDRVGARREPHDPRAGFWIVYALQFDGPQFRGASPHGYASMSDAETGASNCTIRLGGGGTDVTLLAICDVDPVPCGGEPWVHLDELLSFTLEDGRLSTRVVRRETIPPPACTLGE